MMLQSAYILVQEWTQKGGHEGSTAYALDDYDSGMSAEELITSATAACHGSLVDTSGMKVKNYVNDGVVYKV